jgi:hypothetical protein
MAKYIALDIKKIYQTGVDFSQGIPVDGIIQGQEAVDGSGNTELLVQFQFKAEPYRIQVSETLAQIVAEATAAGYTENGLTIVPINKVNQTEFSPAKDMLLNLQSFNVHTISPKFDTDGTTVIGSIIQYSKEHEKKPIRLETAEILIPQVVSGSGDGEGLGEELL